MIYAGRRIFFNNSITSRLTILLVAYTDGVTESEDSQGATFGQTRQERTLCDSDTEDAQEVLQHIVDELYAHSAGCLQAGDITLVVVRVAAK